MSRPDAPPARGSPGEAGAAAHRMRAEVLESQRLPAEHHRLLLRAPEIAARAQPGQFLHIWCHPPDDIASVPCAALLRRPYSISRLAPPDGIEILLRLRGAGGRLLASVQQKARLDIIGPLGRGFRVQHNLRTAVIVAGGIGIAPVPFLIQTLAAGLLHVHLLVGAADDNSLPYRVQRDPERPASLPALEALGADVTFVSESADHLLVSELLERRLSEFEADSSAIFAIGPRAMLKRLAEIAAGRLPLQVSLEERMACGLGACRSCVVPVRSDGGPAYKTVCRDGPVFDAAEIDWERLEP